MQCWVALNSLGKWIYTLKESGSLAKELSVQKRDKYYISSPPIKPSMWVWRGGEVGRKSIPISPFSNSGTRFATLYIHNDALC